MSAKPKYAAALENEVDASAFIPYASHVTKDIIKLDGGDYIKIIRLQGDGDYDGAVRFAQEMGTLSPTLKADLARLAGAGIPVDVVFEQGKPF